MKALLKNVSKYIPNQNENISKNFRAFSSFNNFNLFQSQNINCYKKGSNNKKNIHIFTSKNFSKNSSEWMNRHKTDFYVKKSVEKNYRSRAAFKLIEIQNKYKVLKKGQRVIDVGSAPGGWSQIISELVGSSIKNPNVIAVDILKMDPIDGVYFIQGDLTRSGIQDMIMEKNNFDKFDVIMSDMCPEFIGQKYTDHSNLINLNQMTFDFAAKFLKFNGILVMKTFEGSMQKKLQENIDVYFEKIQRFKPASSRSESSEMYLICTGYMEGTKIKEELDKIQNADLEKLTEEKKILALRNYQLSKYDDEFDKESLKILRENIISAFKLDPEEIKVSKEEEEEIKKNIEKEKKEFHDEYFGQGYFHNPKNFSELIELYINDQKEQLEKMKKISLTEKMDENTIKSFLEADEQVKHLEELAKSELKEIQYLDTFMNRLESEIENQEKQENLREDNKTNKILQTYEKWEEFYKMYEEQIKEEEIEKIAHDNNQIRDDLQKEENDYDYSLQNEVKNRKKQQKRNTENENKDPFFKKANKN